MYKLRRLIGKFKYGLFFKYLFDKMSKCGIKITPYYWVEEGLDAEDYQTLGPMEPPFYFQKFTQREIKDMGNIHGRDTKEADLLERLEKGQLCYGIKSGEEVAAFSWVQIGGHPTGREVRDDEAYFFDAFTLEKFRGKNLNTLVRRHCYKRLREEGIKRFYSATEFFNSPAMKLKKKLNARPRKFLVYYNFFNKWKGEWLIKEYRQPPDPGL